MLHPQPHPGRVFQRPFERLRDHHGSMPSTRTTNRDRQVTLALGHVMRKRERQKRGQALDEVLGDLMAAHETNDLCIATREMTQAIHEVWIWQTPHVEYEIGLGWRSRLEPEAEDRKRT